MASTTEPRIYTYQSTAAMPQKGVAVVIGATRDFVAVATGVASKMCGISQGTTQNPAERIEVALPGGGAKALAGGTIAAGDKLTSNASGALVTSTATTDRIIALAMEAAVLNDIFSVEVIIG